MPNLTVTAGRVALVVGGSEHQITAPAAAATTAGQVVRLDTTTGRLTLANAASAGNVGAVRGIALMTVAAGEAVTAAITDSVVDMGDALDALAFDAAVFLSDTNGTLADGAGTVSSIVGRVVPGFAKTGTPDKLLRLT